ncbi:MAG: hypothetical protein U9P72_10405 [Campylobacterota bacterium]|nr:hypothetical protein [Campylobacterota bacterium]
MNKKGIALLITLLFIIAITLSIGIGLKQVKVASSEIQNENFMLQTTIILDDVLKFLKTSKDLEKVASDNTGEALYMFLSQSSFIPFEASDIKISLEIVSARAKLNINAIVDINGSKSDVSIARIEALKVYLSNYNINEDYTNILLDVMGKVKEDMSYNSDIFYEKPYLFRDFVVSDTHLGEVNDFYMKTYHDNNLKNIDFEKLFSFNSNIKTAIDLNYASAEVWELILGVDKLRAEELSFGSGSYTKLDELGLSNHEKLMLDRFKTSYFEPHLDVNIEIMQNSNMAKIHFEYDIKNKKGSNFSYEI